MTTVRRTRQILSMLKVPAQTHLRPRQDPLYPRLPLEYPVASARFIQLMVPGLENDQVRWLSQLFHNHGILTLHEHPKTRKPALAIGLPYDNEVPSVEKVLGLVDDDGPIDQAAKEAEEERDWLHDGEDEEDDVESEFPHQSRQSRGSSAAAADNAAGAASRSESKATAKPAA